MRLPAATALLLIAISGCFYPAYCQSATSGALAGTVKDSTGAAIPNVTVTLSNPATSQALTITTGSDGSYRFSLLPPGAYGVRFESQGFKTARMPAVAINISDVPTLDAALEHGEPSEQVVCRCHITMATSSTSTVVDARTITSVPLTTRNFTQVVSMSSGSAADVNNAGTLGRGTRSVNVNGNTSGGAYTLDGAFAPSAVPNPDTISELKIQNSQYDAVYGAQVPTTALITKSGENQFHGDAWEFVRNDIFNANSFFRSSTGQSKPVLKQNQFGGTMGGPIKAKKLFYFGSYQGTRQVNGLDTTSTSNPILPPLTSDRSAAALAAQFCPANHVLASGPGAGQPDPRYLTFAGGKQLDCNNQSTAATAPINPVALRLLQMKRPDGFYLIPVPQTILAVGDNAGLGFSSYSLPSTYRENQYLLNGDYLLSAKNTFSWRSYLATINQYRTFSSPLGYPGAPILPGQGTPQALQAKDIVASLNLTSVFTGNTVNEARMSFTRSKQDAQAVDAPSATSLGMTPADPLFDRPPEITVLGPLGSFRLFGNVGNDFSTENKYYSGADNLSWVHGKQSIRAGTFLLTQYNWREDTGTARGKLSFQTFSDFLLGLSADDNLSPSGRSNIQAIQANEGVGPNGEVQYQYRSYYGAAFVQDDVKVSSRLSLNLGLRWEYIGPALDTAGTIGNAWPSLLSQVPIPPASGTLMGNTVAANYRPGLINPYTGLPFGPPPSGVFARSTNSFYRNGTPLDTFAPRFGFAWQPLGGQGRLAIRGGYGWFYQATAYSANASGTPLFTAPPFAQGFTNADSSNNLSSFQRPFPDTTLGYVPRTPTSELSDRVAGPDYILPRLQQWNFSTQFHLWRTLSLDAGYFGSKGSRLLISRGLNQPLLAGAAGPVNCGYDGVPADCITTNTSENAGLRVPILGETPTALADNEFAGASSYHSLQATLRLKAWRGLGFQAAYTFSRAANNTAIANDLNNLSLDWARASFDRTHRFTTNFDYELPALLRTRGVAGTMLRGWSLSGIIIVQSGLPMTLTDPNGGGVYGHAAVSTVTLCPGATYASLATPGAASSRLNNWIDTAAICAPAAVGSDGSAGYGSAGQSIMIGPGQFNTDFSLGKMTRVGGVRESAVLAFRMEFYNALNHPQFANPGTSLGTATFGVITQPSVAPRLIQFALKYLF
ncbi:MAG TPA: TonB-dependent receptor [Bryobacteraceae bacterium]|nr:TonB-dependent receptor [Bryobacteraceae bacterium]